MLFVIENSRLGHENVGGVAQMVERALGHAQGNGIDTHLLHVSPRQYSG
jgi:hypothetical protein